MVSQSTKSPTSWQFVQQRGCALHLQLALATSPEVVEAMNMISPLGRPRLVVALLPQSSLYSP